MLHHELIAKLDMKSPAVWLATWGGFGLIRKAPGTWGTLGGLPVGCGILYVAGPFALFIAILIVSAIGYKVTQKFEAMSGEHDAGAIVIDEVAGIWLTLLAAPLSWLAALFAFALFRFFDILKPWPVSWFDRLPGAAGVMADDLMAGVYAALCLGALHYAGLV